jgi:peptidoglycan/LPS O-acetylase OafA/YrhL
MKFAGWYGIVVGLLMLGMWSFFLAAGQVPELQSEPFRIAFHLAAEFTTAITLIIAGVGLLGKSRRAKSIYFVAAGLLLYSLIVSPGYYAQQGQWAFVGMFACLAVLTLVCVVIVFRSGRDP